MNPQIHPFPIPIYPPPPGGVVVGGNTTDAPFPVVIEGDLGDRYLHGYELDGRLVWDLFRWSPQARSAVYEVRGSYPVGAGGWVSVNDGLQFRSPDDEFELSLYQLGEAQVLEVSVGSTTLTADDRCLEISGNTFAGCSVSGMLAMFRIGIEGSISFGVSGPPPVGMFLLFLEDAGEAAA